MFLEIPLLSMPQTVSTILSINGQNKPVLFRMSYNTEGEHWQASLMDEDGNVMLENAPVVTTVSDPGADPGLLGQFSYLGYGDIYIIRKVEDIPNQDPVEDDIDSNFSLVWGDPE